MSRKSNSQGSVACIRVPNFCWQLEARREPSLKEVRPVFITATARDIPDNGFGTHVKASKDSRASERIVLDCSSDVTDVMPGMPLEVGQSRHNGALLVQGDVPRYIAAFEKLLTGFANLAPAVEDAGPGVAYIDLGGLDRLYGSPAKSIRRLAESAGDLDLRIGVGKNKWQAYLASLKSGVHNARRIVGEPSRFVGSLSVEHLPVPYKIVERLHMFGIYKLGEIAKLPQGPIEAQFGLTGRLMWRLANGIDDRPLIPRKVVESVSGYLSFPDATVSMATIFSGIESLLGETFARPQMLRRYARQAVLQSQVFQKPPWVMEVAFKEPAGSKNHAIFGIKAKLDSTEFTGPLEDLRLTLTGLSSEPWKQESMWQEARKEDHLRQAVGQLAARLGLAPPIYQVRELEPWSRIPERRHALVQLSH